MDLNLLESINLDNDNRVGKQLSWNISIQQSTQTFSSYGLHSTYMYIHTEREIDRHIHTCIIYTNGDGNIRLQCTQRNSYGLSNLVESQGTVIKQNKTNASKTANNASVYNLTSPKAALDLRDPRLAPSNTVVSQNGYKNAEYSQKKVR